MSTIPTIRSVIPRSALPRPAVVRSQRSSSITVSTAATLHSVASSSLSPSPSPAPVHRLRSSLADLSISKPKRTGDVSRLYVSIVMGIPTVLHTLAVVRAIEEKFGRVLDIQQMRVSRLPPPSLPPSPLSCSTISTYNLNNPLAIFPSILTSILISQYLKTSSSLTFSIQSQNPPSPPVTSTLNSQSHHPTTTQHLYSVVLLSQISIQCYTAI